MLERKKILIIDDDPATAREVKKLAGSDEFEIIWAPDGRDALRRLKVARPDLILLDLVLPDTSGFRIAQLLKRLPLARHIPIIAISLKKEDIDKHVALKSGVLEYMVKPLNPDRLSFLMHDLLKK